jgi:uncharacterized protein YcbK (DUF882 family)
LSLPAISFGKVELIHIEKELNKEEEKEKILSEFLGIKEKSRGEIHISRTRRLKLYNPHTKERFNEVYYINGKYRKKILSKLNYFLRDFRENKSKKIDLELIDLVYSLQKTTSPNKELKVLSGYRTKRTNRLVKGAKKSQHMNGKAIDIAPINNSRYKLTKIKKQATKKKIGGVGFYRRKGFVHVDTGPVRSWG